VGATTEELTIRRFRPNPHAPAQSLVENVVKSGDILYIDYSQSVGSQLGIRPHMAFVVGWGEYVSKWSEIVPVPPATSVPIYQSYTLARNAGVQNPVPYIVDHGPGGESGSGFSFARPYYALWWNAIPNVRETRLDDRATIRFMQVPTIVSLQVNPNGTATPRFRPTAPSVNLTQLYLGVSPTPTATATP
jgi:hypothetical protein